MAWQGMVAAGHKEAAAQAYQASADAHNVAARAKQQQPTVDYSAPATPPTAKGDGLTSHFDGSFAPGPCKCGWKRDGRLHLARRIDGSLIEGNTCPDCHKALYQ